MFAANILFALVMAFVFTMVFAVGLQRPGPWSTILTFFLIIFLVAWACSLWINPFRRFLAALDPGLVPCGRAAGRRYAETPATGQRSPRSKKRNR